MRNALILITVLLSWQSYLFGQSTVTPEVVNGTIDVSNWNFSTNGIINLNGNWEMYWDTLMGPATFISGKSPVNESTIPVPASWSSKKAGKYPTLGMATYHLKINTGKKEGLYGLRIYDIFTASRVWFDNRLIYSTGVVGNSVKTSKPGFTYENIPIILNGNTDNHDLIIQASNFYHTRAGIIKPLFFGNFDQLTGQTKRLLVINMIIVGIILIISFNHLLYYFLRRTDRSNLYFGLLCFVMILRSISTDNRIITFFFPNINWELLFKFDNFSGFGTIPLFALFLYYIFKKEFPKTMLYALVSVGLLITLFVFATPQLVYGRFRMFYEIYILFGGLYLTFAVLLRASLHKREGALLTFIGFFLLYGTAINDVLVSMGIAHTPDLAPYGLVTYMLIQSYILSRRSAIAMVENEQLSTALQQEKQMLEERVEQRTDELKKQNDENIKHREELQIQGWFNESLTRVNTILNNNKDNLKKLSQRLIAEIVAILNAHIGAIYLLNDNDDQPELLLTSSWNASREMLSEKSIIPGEGLVGACFSDMKSTTLSDIPENFIKLSSGLGESVVKNLALIPIKANDIAVGVIEIASINRFTSQQLDLLEKISENISSTIQFLRINEKNSRLIDAFTKKESQLNQQEDEMRFHLEELRSLREEVETYRSKAKKEN